MDRRQQVALFEQLEGEPASRGNPSTLAPGAAGASRIGRRSVSHPLLRIQAQDHALLFAVDSVKAGGQNRHRGAVRRAQLASVGIRSLWVIRIVIASKRRWENTRHPGR
jgi:hypothetical protein